MTGPLRVLYLIDSLAPGGSERSLVDMVPLLVERGIDLHVAVLHDRPGLTPELRAHGVDVLVVDGSGRWSRISAARRVIRRLRPALVHTTLFESDVIGRIAGRLEGAAVVSSLVNTPYGADHIREVRRGWAKVRAAWALDTATARVVDRFHAVSGSTATTMAARLRIPADRIEVIPRGRARSRLGWRNEARRTETRHRLRIGEAPVVLAVARQDPQKGLETAVDALAGIRRVRPDARLLLAGAPGRATSGIEARARATGCHDAVRFLGRRDDVPDLLCAADLFVLPSTREGMPGAVLEAMALETPIVASDIPTVREAVPDERFARLVRPGDGAAWSGAVLRALEDAEGTAARVRASRRRFDTEFDLGSISDRMVAFYRAVARDGDAGGAAPVPHRRTRPAAAIRDHAPPGGGGGG